MKYQYDELLTKLKNVNLDLAQATRIEPLDNNDRLMDYNPYSDIVNILPVAAASAINNLNGSDCSDAHIEAFASMFLDQLLPEAFNSFEGVSVEQKLLSVIRSLKNSNKELFARFTESVFVNLFLCYTVANKFGLRTCPDKMTGRGYFRYFALLDIFNDLSEDTQTAILKDLGAQNLWEITEQDIKDM